VVTLSNKEKHMDFKLRSALITGTRESLPGASPSHPGSSEEITDISASHRGCGGDHVS
jgi:hypothetical protein